MGEAIVWIILVVVIVALVIGLIALIFKVLVAAIAAIVAGVIAGYLILTVANWAQIRKLDDPATLASVGHLRLTSTGLNFEFVDAKVEEWARSNDLNWLAALSSGGIAAWALYLGTTNTPSINASIGSDWLPVTRFLIWIVPVVLIVIFGNGAGMNRSRTPRIRSRVESLAGRLRLCLASAGTLDLLEGQIASLAKTFNISWPNQYRKALERYIELNAPQLLCDAHPAEELLKTLMALATLDCEKLERAKKSWNQVWSRYDKLASLLRYAKRPALARELDDFAANLPGLAELLPQRQWEAFAVYLSDAENELESLECNATESESVDRKPQPQSPYDVLGVSKDMTLKDIKSVYRGLANTYHDRPRSENTMKILERRMQQINDAWAEIEKTHIDS